MNRASFGVLAFALLAYTALAVGYATRTPIWQNPDEPAHFNYVAHVARTGTLPELQPGDWDYALLERLKNGRLEPADKVESIRYESWQPPLYYMLAAPLFLTGPSDVATQVLKLRGLGVVLGGATLVVAYLVASEVLPRGLALAVPLVMAGVPMFTAVSASISADPLANLLSALLLLVLARRLPSPIADDRWPLIAGALLGLGLLAKLALAIFVPLALLVAIARSRTAIRHAALLISTLTLVLLPWLVHQVTTYGWADPLATVRHAAVVADQPRFASLSPEYAWSFLTITFHSFWAQFGWMAIPAPDILYWIWGLLALSGAFGLARRRKWVATPPAVLLLATCAAACAALIAYNFSFTQFQGRYLFSALVPFATLLVAGWSDWLPSRAQALGVSAIGASLIAVNAYTFWRVLIPGFASIS